MLADIKVQKTSISKISLGLLISIISLSACNYKVGPDYKTPLTQVSSEWLETGNIRLNQSKEFRDWWRLFNDPVLNQLIQTAYAQNLTLRAAGVRILNARAEVGIAIGDLYPQQQGAETELSDLRNPFLKKLGNGLGNSLMYSRIGLMANWEIDFWGKYRRAIEAADAQLMGSIAEYDNLLVSLLSDVANEYIQLRTIEKRLQIAKENVKLQLESKRIADAKFTGGISTQRDVEQATTILKSTQASIPSLERQLRQIKNALSLLMGIPPDRFVNKFFTTDKVGIIPAPPVQVAVGIPTDLLRRRPDIRKAEMDALAQSARIGVVVANLYPAFSLTGSFGFVSSNASGSSLGDMFNWGNQFYRFGPSVQWNIFNYGQITNQVRAQDAAFEVNILNYQNQVLKAQKEVEDALIGFLMSQNSAEYLAESTDSAQRALDLAILQYNEGITDFTTVLTAEQELLRQQDDFAQTLGSISINLVGIYRALGGGWEIREGKEFVPEPIVKAMEKRTNWGGLLAHTPVPTEPPTNLFRLPQW
jgi:NodT family efflux transporter outer membrane factor (OMF) lipoprotein